MIKQYRTGLVFLFLFSISFQTLFAWKTNGVAVCTTANIASIPELESDEFTTIASDGSGGAIITWRDLRNSSTYGIYAQRVDSTGNNLWATNGVPICTAANSQYWPTIVSDSAGGAIITWEDERNGTHIYAQRVNSTGSTLWTTNGVAISTAAGYQEFPTLVSDGLSGAIITWMDSHPYIYAQRVNSSGSTLWTLNGVAICTESSVYPTIVSDEAGGAVITWQDDRVGIDNIYAQRVNSVGSTLWTFNGVAVSTSVPNEFAPTIASNGSGGAIITWYNTPNSTTRNIYAQGVDSAGNTLWTTNGIAICTVKGYQSLPVIISDGSNGAIITWTDTRNDTTGVSEFAYSNLFAQRVNSAGSTLWLTNGVAICTANNYQQYPTMVSDGSGGAIITWYDDRNGSTNNIYAQEVNSNGSTLWTLNGVAICTAANNQEYPSITGDGSGGAIITWDDERNGVNFNIYAEKVNDNGLVPVRDWFNYSGFPKRK